MTVKGRAGVAMLAKVIIYSASANWPSRLEMGGRAELQYRHYSSVVGSPGTGSPSWH
jgi:hypothetical protein